MASPKIRFLRYIIFERPLTLNGELGTSEMTDIP